MSREEPHDSSEAKLAEDEEGSTGEEGREGKRNERGGDDRLGVIFPNYFGDLACKDVEEWLRGRQTIEGHFPQVWQGGEGSRMTYHYFYHHATVPTCEFATTEREYELRDNRPTMAARIREDPRAKGIVHT